MHLKVFVGLGLAASLLLVACGGGGGGSGAASMDPPPPTSAGPAITIQPSDQTAPVGQPATFTVAATGTAPLSYQWQRGGSALTGATGSSYTTAVTTAGDSGSVFAVVVTDAGGSTTSRNATLTVTSGAVPAGT